MIAARQSANPGRFSSRVVEKFGRLASLSGGDRALLTAVMNRERTAPARVDLIGEGDRPGPLFVILSGWAYRYKILLDGTRQILAFLMPGDWSDVDAAQLAEMDHGIHTLTPVRYAAVPRSDVLGLLDRPQLAQAFRSAQLIDGAISRAWMINIGRRDARTRTAHLFCELYLRSADVGLASYGGVDLPISQIALADALGITAVHINRVLADFRRDDVMTLRAGLLRIRDWKRLSAIAGFDDNYLHRRDIRPASIALAG